MKKMKRFLMLLILSGIVTSCSDQYGVISAYLRLRDDSPLPSWVMLPKGINRNQASATIIIYESTDKPDQGKVRVVIKKKHQLLFNKIQEEIGTWCWHPASLRQNHPGGNYPNWIIIEVKGTKEVYESSEPNDLLKIVNKSLD